MFTFRWVTCIKPRIKSSAILRRRLVHRPFSLVWWCIYGCWIRGDQCLAQITVGVNTKKPLLLAINKYTNSTIFLLDLTLQNYMRTSVVDINILLTKKRGEKGEKGVFRTWNVNVVTTGFSKNHDIIPHISLSDRPRFYFLSKSWS